MRFVALCAGVGLMAFSHMAASGDPPPVVTLNHFYVVVDAATYEAARTSPFLTREFAPFEARTTVRNDKSYTGIYWYGRATYFELFEPGEQGPAGASGLALGVEQPEASALVKQHWEAALGGAGGGLVTRKTETDEVPWFEMTYAREIPGVRVWLMEYHTRLPRPLVRRAHASALDHTGRRARPLRGEDRPV